MDCLKTVAVLQVVERIVLLSVSGLTLPYHMLKSSKTETWWRKCKGPDTPGRPFSGIFGPCFCGVSRTGGISRPLLPAFGQFEHVEPVAEPVCERNPSDWLFSLSQSVYKRRKQSKQMT